MMSGEEARHRGERRNRMGSYPRPYERKRSLRERIAILLGIIFVFILCVPVLVHAEDKTKPEESEIQDGAAPMLNTDRQELLNQIMKDRLYRNWKRWPGKGPLYPGTQPDGAFLTTYVNTTAMKSIKKKRGMQYGSIIVNENYGEDRKLIAITAMHKLNGFDPEGGDWYWVQYTPDTETEVWGKIDTCIRCHHRNRENDYIFSGEVVRGSLRKTSHEPRGNLNTDPATKRTGR